jgi:peroxiredoxin
MALHQGEKAPDFSLYDDEQNLVRLGDLDDPVLLLFFPGAFTSVCTNEMVAVSDDLERYADHDVQVYGISTDAPPVLAEFRERHEIQFPLLSDHDAEAAAAYEAKYDGNFTPMNLDRVAKRAAYLIDRAGRIRYAEVLDDAGQQPDFEAIREKMNVLEA